MQYETVVIGGGVAGLTCAIKLHAEGRPVVLLEGKERVGGRIATDLVDGFQLDHGFQVVQTGYPDLGSYLDLKKLDLKPFPAGVLVRYKGKFHPVADPRAHPGSLLSTLIAPIGSVADRLRMLRLVRAVTQKSMGEIFEMQDEPALDFLRRQGFSDTFIHSFFVPFFAGATLERSLNASSNVLQYLIRVFAMGDACLPAGGMSAIPEQLVAQLPSHTVRCNAHVEHIEGNVVTLHGGEQLRADNIVLATDEPSLKQLVPQESVRRSVAETCIYFSAEQAPSFPHPFLILNGDRGGPINNIAFPSRVAPQYAPKGKTLIAVVVLGAEWQGKSDLEDMVVKQCVEWFGKEAGQWTHLATYRLDHALPDQSPPGNTPYQLAPSHDEHTVVCGEHRNVPGLLWAMMSGRLAAEKILG